MKKLTLLILFIAAILVGGGFLMELEPTDTRFGYALIGGGAVYLFAGLGLLWSFLSEEVAAHG